MVSTDDDEELSQESRDWYAGLTEQAPGGKAQSLFCRECKTWCALDDVGVPGPWMVCIRCLGAAGGTRPVVRGQLQRDCREAAGVE